MARPPATLSTMPVMARLSRPGSRALGQVRNDLRFPNFPKLGSDFPKVGSAAFCINATYRMLP
jgi:hypothetical protein